MPYAISFALSRLLYFKFIKSFYFVWSIEQRKLKYFSRYRNRLKQAKQSFSAQRENSFFL